MANNPVSKPFCDPAYDGALTQLATGQINLHHIEVDNTASDDYWLQLFDAASAEDVDLGTTPPTLVFLVPSGDGTLNGQMEKTLNTPAVFNLGMFYAVTTAPAGATPPDDDVVLNFLYRDPLRFI